MRIFSRIESPSLRFDAVVRQPRSHALVCLHGSTKQDTILTTELSKKVSRIPNGKQGSSYLPTFTTSSVKPSVLRPTTLPIGRSITRTQTPAVLIQDPLEVARLLIATSTRTNGTACVLSPLWSLTRIGNSHATKTGSRSISSFTTGREILSSPLAKRPNVAKHASPLTKETIIDPCVRSSVP